MEKEIYKDCRRNHACHIGGYAIDGCTEFIQRRGLKPHCEACGCHRNYHRKVISIDLEQCDKSFVSLREAKRMARERGHDARVPPAKEVKQDACINFKQRKSKFSMGQREAMRGFAESLGWSVRNKGRQEEIDMFCERIGVSRLVFKTWLNNNKKCYIKGTASATTTTSEAYNSSAKNV